jgi:hypothetical protein
MSPAGPETHQVSVPRFSVRKKFAAQLLIVRCGERKAGLRTFLRWARLAQTTAGSSTAAAQPPTSGHMLIKSITSAVN